MTDAAPLHRTSLPTPRAPLCAAMRGMRLYIGPASSSIIGETNAAEAGAALLTGVKAIFFRAALNEISQTCDCIRGDGFGRSDPLLDE